MQLAKNFDDLNVGIGEYKVSKPPKRLITLGLGSCVGVSMWDPITQVGGLIHIMLPNSKDFSKLKKPQTYADLGIPLMVKDLIRHGARQSSIKAKLVGGAQMFSGVDKKLLFNIGERNIEMSRKILKELSIVIISEDVGGNKGRSMYFNLANGEVQIKTLGRNIKVI